MSAIALSYPDERIVNEIAAHGLDHQLAGGQRSLSLRPAPIGLAVSRQCSAVDNRDHAGGQ